MRCRKKKIEKENEVWTRISILTHSMNEPKWMFHLNYMCRIWIFCRMCECVALLDCVIHRMIMCSVHYVQLPPLPYNSYTFRNFFLLNSVANIFDIVSIHFGCVKCEETIIHFIISFWLIFFYVSLFYGYLGLSPFNLHT